jgi:kynureninase
VFLSLSLSLSLHLPSIRLSFLFFVLLACVCVCAGLQLHPREGEYTLRTEDIVDAIQDQGDKLALVLMSGVQYYTGQWFDLPTITSAAHK